MRPGAVQTAWLALAMAVGWPATPAAPRPPATAPIAVCLAPAATRDATPVLRACLAATPTGATLRLAAETFHLRSPLVIDRRVTVATAGRGTPCDGGGGCATLAIEPMADGLAATAMPITIAAAGVSLVRVQVIGHGGRDRALDAKTCGDSRTRPAGGGIRVAGARFTLDGAVVRGVSCYSAMEVLAGVDLPSITHSIFGPNGDHRPGEVWADGLTVHDATRARIADNLFVDNTDVQLILGGCRACTISANRFRHRGGFAGGAFAELMLQSWPNTSGRFDGTLVSGNDIDCGARRRCGFGIMLGAAPWYPGRAAGGTVTQNRVARAQVGIDVDGLTGAMSVTGNRVTHSGGRAHATCGVRTWPAINVAPSARSLVGAIAGAGSVDTRGCLLNVDPD